MKTQMIVAGHGGQGVLELGNYICYLGLLKGDRVAYVPSYGPESRGGKVKCYVISSDKDIASPVVEEPDYLIIMNIPSMDYVPLLRKDGTLLMNSSLIPGGPERTDINVAKIPAVDIAVGLADMHLKGIQDTRLAANAVMFGVYLAVTREPLNLDLVQEVFEHFLTDRKMMFIPLDMEAVKRGYQYALENGLVPETVEDELKACWL